MRHRITARAPRAVAPPPVHTSEDMLVSVLSDAAHVPGGFAAGVTFPSSEAEVAAVVVRARRILPIGAQSSLTGGATPRGETVLSTRALRAIAPPHDGRVRLGAGVPIVELQHRVAQDGLFYPAAPTFEGACVGGVIATNAAGPSTFKYGSTRPWVEAMTVVLASGDVLDVVRGRTIASSESPFEIVRPSGDVFTVPVPSYSMPAVAKLSAGYFATRDDMDLIDLFIGSEGTLGIVVDATMRLVARPSRCAVLVECRSDEEAVAVTASVRGQARETWEGRGVLDVAAIEYMDARSLEAVPDAAFSRAHVDRRPGAVLLLIQVELHGAGDEPLVRLQEILVRCGIESTPRVALPGDERGFEQLLSLREAVPVAINALVAEVKTRAPQVEKTAGDMIVPFERVLDSIAVYHHAFERRGLRYAIWGHLSDGNLHPNVVPASLEDVARGREALLEIADAIARLGGAPLAEHGVGRNAIKQRMLLELYGHEGIEQMRAVKRALDPDWKLSPGVLFAE